MLVMFFGFFSIGRLVPGSQYPIPLEGNVSYLMNESLDTTIFVAFDC